jgi:DNA-binding winged helix-turn-helix (wHTH) protein/tetratricopeptide (TPR) repeat protein
VEPEYQYRFGPFLLNPGKRVLLRDQLPVQIYGKAFDTLLMLVRHADRLVKKEELFKEVWADRTVEENNLSQSISAVRKALGDRTAPHVYVVTVPGWGYRFAAPVSQFQGAPPISDPVGALSVAHPTLTPVPEAAETGGQTPKLAFVIPNRSRQLTARALLFTALLCLVVLGVGWGGYRIFAHSGKRPAVAVVGFVNLSGQPDLAWLSPALAEMMTTELGVSDKVVTIPEETIARAKTELKLEDQNGFSDDTLSRLRRDLHADVIVSGAYAVLPGSSDVSNKSLSNKGPQPGSQQVRLDLRVQNAASGALLAALSESGEQSDLFAMVSHVGSRLRQDLGVSGAEERETRQARASVSSNPEAVRLYTEGTAKLRTFDALTAKTWLTQAVNADPGYAMAHEALSQALGVLGYEKQSQQEARRAFELSGPLSTEQRLAIQGRYCLLNKDWNGAVQAYLALTHLSPENQEYGLDLASAQISASNPHAALEILTSLRRLPLPAGSDPRIPLKEYEAWKLLGDFGQMSKALTEAANASKEQGALLLLARARSRLCWVERSRAQSKALDDCHEAERIYSVVGDRRGEAETTRCLADIVSTTDVKSAISLYQHSLALEEEIGHLSGQASVWTQLGTLYGSQGDHVLSQQMYEKAIRIFQQQDNKTELAGVTLNVANQLTAQGRLEEADRMYREVLDSAGKIGNKYIAALAQDNIGINQAREGNLDAALSFLREGRNRFNELGNKDFDVALTRTLGELAMLQGDYEHARRYYQEAISLPQASQQKLQAAETELDLDELDLEEGHNARRLEPSIRRVLEVFRRGTDLSGNNSADDQASSLILLARCLQADGEFSNASATAQQAVKMSARAELDVRLRIAVAAARVDFAASTKAPANSASASEISTRLRGIMAEARKLRYPMIELEAQLALGEIEMESGAVDNGRSLLQTVAAEASRRHYSQIARKAKAAASVT